MSTRLLFRLLFAALALTLVASGAVVARPRGRARAVSATRYHTEIGAFQAIPSSLGVVNGSFQFQVILINDGPNNATSDVGLTGFTDSHSSIRLLTAPPSIDCVHSLTTFTCLTHNATGLKVGGQVFVSVTIDLGNSPAEGTPVVFTAIGSADDDASFGDDIATGTGIVHIADPVLTKTHSGNFPPGGTGAYTLTVSNAGSQASGNLEYDVIDTLPAGLTATSMTGSGWNCVLGTLTCVRNGSLNPGASFPAITLNVDVAPGAPAAVTNSAFVQVFPADVNSANNGAADLTVIGAPSPSVGSASLLVHKDFSDANTAPVTIGVSCTSGAAPAASPLPARDNPDAPAAFTINNIPAGGTVCTATESPVPAGYTATQTACGAVALAQNDVKGCTITNTATSVPQPPATGTATLTVHKDFTDANNTPVTVSVSCSNGALAAAPLPARDNPDTPAVFTITAVPAAGTACSASEGAVAGYTLQSSTCAAVALTQGSSGSCTLTNKPIGKGP